MQMQSHLIKENLTNEPSSMQQALQSGDAAYWKQTVDSECESLICNKAWKLVELPVGHATIR